MKRLVVNEKEALRRSCCKLSEIIFNMERTDVDTCQFGIKITEKSYRYIQLRDIIYVPKSCLNQAVIDYYNQELKDNDSNTYNTNKLLQDFKNGKSEAIHIIDCPYFWDDEVIDLNHYSNDEIVDYLNDYYPMDEIKEMHEKNIEMFNQLACEAIFEMEFVYVND